MGDLPGKAGAIQIESLNLEERKAQLLLEQEKTKLRISAIDARAATASAKAELEKARSDRSTSPERLKQLELVVQESQQREGAIAQQQSQQAESAANQAQIFSLNRQTLSNQQSLRRQNLQTDLALLGGAGTIQTTDSKGFVSLSNQPATGATNQQQQPQNIPTKVELVPVQFDTIGNGFTGVFGRLDALVEGVKAIVANGSKLTPVAEGGIQITNNNTGTFNAREAAELATRKTLNALERALKGVS